MSTGIGPELTAAFESASEFVQPSPELADRARARVRRAAPPGLAVTAATTAVLLAAAGAGMSSPARTGLQPACRPRWPGPWPSPRSAIRSAARCQRPLRLRCCGPELLGDRLRPGDGQADPTSPCRANQSR